jgi:3-methyl-2-oxobutanoate hydroxymethyltransferase
MKLTVADLLEKKKRGEKIVMLTSYDYPTAALEDECGVDIQLIGDSVGTNVLGYDDVSQVTVEDMVHHVRAVARGAKRSFVLGDMPYRSFDTEKVAVENARRLTEAGADGIKMEGEEEAEAQVRRVVREGIPVCAHIGYTPQTDGSRPSVQGKEASRAIELLDISRRLEDVGASLLVLELVPEALAGRITSRLSIPTIGIGAGRYCDGQVQVVFDILGLTPRVFRHAKAYAGLREVYGSALRSYAGEVRGGQFPTEANAPKLPEEVNAAVEQWCEQHPAAAHGNSTGAAG